MLTPLHFELVPVPKIQIKGVYLPGHDREEYVPPTTICPYGCEGVVIPYTGAETTLVGYIGVDTNHWTEQCTCPKCEKEFVHEWVFSDQNDWYCDKRHGKVLLGVPSCCESVYKYPCECGGTMTNTNKGGIVSYVSGKRSPERDIVKCDQCDKTRDITSPTGI